MNLSLAPPREASLATAGLPFAKLLQAGRALEELVCAFEMNVVAAHKVSLRIANQPVAGVYMQDTSLRGNIRGLFDLNRFHQERLD
jgi:hypothetical protein